MKDNLSKIKEMDLENLYGLMAMHVLVNGNRVNLMDKENFLTKIGIMKESLNKVKEKEMDLSFGIVEISTKVSGIKIKNMDKANLLLKMAMLLKKVTGLMANSKIEYYIKSNSLILK
jgi:hypothetical protein